MAPVIEGPKSIAENPVPVGCELLPATNDGSLSAEITKTNAPTIAKSGFISGIFFVNLVTL